MWAKPTPINFKILRFYSVPNKVHKIANGVIFSLLALFNNKESESIVSESLPYRIVKSL